MVTLFKAGRNKSSKIEGDIGDDVKHPKSKVKGREFTCPNLALEEKEKLIYWPCCQSLQNERLPMLLK